jgi:hypothetical protein
MSEHTPTPWVSKQRDSEIVIYGPEKIQVVTTSWHTSIRGSYPLKRESLANAAFIVKAVNSHDALRAALAQFVAACDTASPTSMMTEIGRACAVARAALASIKEPA